MLVSEGQCISIKGKIWAGRKNNFFKKNSKDGDIKEFGKKEIFNLSSLSLYFCHFSYKVTCLGFVPNMRSNPHWDHLTLRQIWQGL